MPAVHDSQFDFVPGRGANMAISVSRDVISDCVKKGPPIFLCSLDAEGAIDAIPRSVLFDKCLVFDQMFAGSYWIFGIINSLLRYDGTMF